MVNVRIQIEEGDVLHLIIERQTDRFIYERKNVREGERERKKKFERGRGRERKNVRKGEEEREKK